MDESEAVRRVAVIAHGLRDATAGLAHKKSSQADSVETNSKAEPTLIAPMRVFVSWAHSGESWTAEETAAWAREVVEFTGTLRANGLDAELDLFHTHEPETDWTRFGPQQVAAADYVIIAVSEAWAQRWSGTNNPKKGAGAVGEADALKGMFQEDQAVWQRKVLLVVLPSQVQQPIPYDLARVSRFTVDPDDPATIDTLLRTITAQPLFAKPDIGEVPVLPPGIASSLSKGGKAQTEYGDYAAILEEVKREQSAAKKGKATSDRLSVLMGLLDALSQ